MSTLRVAISGCGNRSRMAWQKHIRTREGFELVGVQDVVPASFEPGIASGDLDRSMCHTDLEAMLASTQPDALIVCNVIESHAAAISVGLDAGCHVLTEKPFTDDLSDAARLASVAESKRLVLAVVQNWRTKSVGATLKSAIASGMIGEVSHVFFRYVRDREFPRLPDYLFEEPDPLLYAMTIHHVDLFRYVLRQEIVSVEGHAFRPSWSRYKHPSSVQLFMRTDRGVVISYVATFSSRNGHIPQESLQVEGETGTLCNDSQYSEPPLILSRRGDEPVDLTADISIRDFDGQVALADLVLLNNFRDAILAGAVPIAPAAENLGSLAVIEAARRCVREERMIDPRTLFERS